VHITEIHVTAYGQFIDQSWEFNPGLNVLCAPNERGKSTLFHLLTTLLFGWSPANVQNFPYRPWHWDLYPEFTGGFVLDDGRSGQIYRKLMSRPRGRIDGPEEGELGNRPLPWAEHIGTRELFTSLYALTLDELTELPNWQIQQWREVLVGSDGLRPTHQVLKELTDEMNALWRNDRRGQPVIRRLEEQRRQLLTQRQELKTEEEELRQAHRELHHIREELEGVEEELAYLKAALPQAYELNQINKLVAQIEDWTAQIGDEALVASLPTDMGQVREDLSRELTELNRSLADKERRKEELEAQSYLDERQRLFLERTPELEGLLRQRELGLSKRQQYEALESQIAVDEARLMDRMGSCFAPGTDIEALLEIPLPDLQGWINRYLQAKEHLDGRRLAFETKGAHRPHIPPPFPSVFALGAFLVALIGGFWGKVNPLGYGLSGGGLLIGGAILILNQIQKIRGREVEEAYQRELGALEGELRKAQEELEAAKGGLAGVFGHLPIISSLLDRPDGRLYEILLGLQMEAQGLRRAQETYAQLGEELVVLEGEIRNLALRLGEEPQADLLNQLTEWQDVLEQARINQGLESQRTGELEKLAGEIRALKDRMENSQTQLTALEEKVYRVASPDLPWEEALMEAERKQELLSYLRGARASLARDYPQWQSQLETGEDWMLDPQAIAARELTRENLQGRRAELKEREGQLKEKLASLGKGITLGELDGQLQALEEEMTEAARRRDQLALLANIIRYGDRLFAQKHQPDVLHRAGDYLAQITEGRYTRLALLTDEEGEEYLAVFQGSNPIPVGQPLSRGILDQIYLALRLATVDHLDAEGERLPLFLDETFVHWDEDRLRGVIPILEEMARTRQVFFFTCHRAMAELFELPILNLVHLAPR
jgi:uncharacterized protein YhaN